VKRVQGTLTLLLMGLLMSLSAPSNAAQTATSFAREYGETLPPVGFVEFCRRLPENCRPEEEHRGFTMTEDKWLLVRMVNSYVNGAIAPIEDEALYGVAEFWTLPTDAGDCEDIMLMKRKILVSKGIPEEALRITVVLDENGNGHAVLTLVTPSGDYVLDNRRNDIRPWRSTGYTFLKRQAAHNPLKWVSLEAAGMARRAGIAGTASK
jgi:predicted transglutaminase-like cysteine proteinase